MAVLLAGVMDDLGPVLGDGLLREGVITVREVIIGRVGRAGQVDTRVDQGHEGGEEGPYFEGVECPRCESGDSLAAHRDGPSVELGVALLTGLRSLRTLWRDYLEYSSRLEA